MMRDVRYEDMTREFDQTAESPVDVPLDHANWQTLALRRKLIEEEFTELTDAIEEVITHRDPEAIAHMLKELGDLQYVVSGFASKFGIPMPALVKRIHDSNMTKFVDGKPLRRRDGKILKGPDYREPDLAGMADTLFVRTVPLFD